MSRRDKKEEKEHKKKHRVLKGILAFLIILFVLMGGFVGYSTYVNGWGWQGLLATMMGHNQTTVEELDKFQVLLLGVSKDIGAELTDTIIVASYDPKNQTAALLSIPRDTFVGKNKNSASSYDKINALYQKGPEKTLEAVNEMTGLDIKYYAVVDNQALIKIVDTIGGVEFDVPIRMKYDDPTQDLHIDLQPGLQIIDGEKAEQLLRFRHNNNGKSYSSEYGDNDLGRMRTQREFITETVKQTLQLKNVMKLGNLLDIIYEYLDTNVKLSDVKDYLPYAIEFNTENIETGAVPGTTAMLNNLSFFEYNKTKTRELVEELFYSEEEVPETSSSNSSSNSSSSTSTRSSNDTSSNSTTISTLPKSETSKIKIELLNGSDRSQKLTEVTNLLKKKGYNVYKTGTVSSNSKTTIIKNDEVSEDILNNLKEILETENVTDTVSNAQSKTEITIIIGKDYK